MASNFMRAPLLSHGQKVCRLYKRACREIEAQFMDKRYGLFPARFNICKLRAQLDENRFLEPKAAKEMLSVFEKEVDKIEHPFPYKFTNSPGGSNYGRKIPDPDWILDTWHPLEKAQYPSYFARRDIRKREFLERHEQLIQEMEKLEGAKGK